MQTINIGKLIKPHGLKGHITLLVDEKYIIDFKQVKMLMVEINKVLTPFFIEDISVRQGKAIVKFDSVHTEAGARELAQKTVAVRTNEVSLAEADEEEALLGYTLIEAQAGELGMISEVQKYPQHFIFQILYKGREVLLPAIEDFIEKIDDKERIVYYKAPEGLLDVYLKEESTGRED